MKLYSVIFALTILCASSEPGFTKSRKSKNVGTSTVLNLEVTPPSQCIGKRVSVKSRLMKLQNNRIGVILASKPYTSISIDALPCPGSGELPFELLVGEQGQSIKRPRYHKRSASRWLENDARQKKLDHFFEQYQLGQTIELTGTLCHLTSSIQGNVQKTINYPRVPDSHYYFSVDDVTVASARAM